MTGEICLKYKPRKESKTKKINLEVKNLSYLGMARGLTFRSKKFSQALLFNFSKKKKWKIHSTFVFFKFLAVYADEDNNILEIKEVNPWKVGVSPSTKYKKLVEIPLNNEHFDEIRKLVDK